MRRFARFLLRHSLVLILMAVFATPMWAGELTNVERLAEIDKEIAALREKMVAEINEEIAVLRGKLESPADIERLAEINEKIAVLPEKIKSPADIERFGEVKAEIAALREKLGLPTRTVELTNFATPARAADYSSKVTLQINRVWTEYDSCLSTGCPTILVTVTNRSAYTLGWIFIECAFLSNGVPVTTAVGIVTNVPSGGSATEKAYNTESIALDSATCRVSSARR